MGPMGPGHGPNGPPKGRVTPMGERGGTSALELGSGIYVDMQRKIETYIEHQQTHQGRAPMGDVLLVHVLTFLRLEPGIRQKVAQCVPNGPGT